MTGKELHDLRTLYGVSQIEVADASAIAVNFVGLLENDERIAEYRDRIAATIRTMTPRAPKRPGRKRKNTQLAPLARKSQRKAIAA